MSLIDPFADVNAVVFDVLQSLEDWFFALIGYVNLFLRSVTALFSDIYNVIRKLGKALKHAAHAILYGAIPDLWRHLQAWYVRFHRWVDWYRRYISAPLRLLHNAQRLLYDTFFRPIIEVVDTVRQITSLIRLFNPKLAAKIDSAIFGLEEKILAPFLFITRRMNLMLSTVQAVITATGLIDADIFIGSIQRDIDSIRRLMTFDFGHAPAGTRVDPLLVLSQDQADFKQFSSSGTGPMADQVSAMTQVFQDSLLALGG